MAPNGQRPHPPATQPPAQRPLEMLWHPHTLAWIIMIGESLAMAMSLSPGISGDRLTLFGLNSLAIQWTTLLCLGLIYLTRNLLQKLTLSAVITCVFAALLLSTCITYVLLWLSLNGVMAPPAGGWPQLLFHMIALSLIYGLLGVIAFQVHWRNRLLAIQTKQAELDALRARVHPHFLFNSLNSAIALVRQNPNASERLLIDLGDLFRAALSRTETVSLQRELELSRQYLDIEAIRFGDRLHLCWNVADTIPAIEIPSLSLQPLMENAIRHGIEPSIEGGTLSVSLSTTSSYVTIEISNPFATTAPSLATSGQRLGLSATRSRLEAHFSGRAVVETTTANNRYLTTVRLPTN